MKRICVALLTGTSLLFCLNACKKVVGEGPIATQERTISNFTAIHSKISGDVYYTTGADYKLEIQAQQNIINVIETFVNDNELLIRFRYDVNVKSHDHVRINITAPSVKGFVQSGSGNLFALSDLTISTLNMRTSGSGNIKLGHVAATDISTLISGSGNIQVAQGTSNHVNANISGSGNIDLVNVLSKTGNTATSGSGGIKVYVTDALDSKISGSGTVWYRGTPRVSAHISGSGQVIPY